jgi:hypothetical protein
MLYVVIQRYNQKKVILHPKTGSKYIKKNAIFYKQPQNDGFFFGIGIQDSEGDHLHPATKVFCEWPTHISDCYTKVFQLLRYPVGIGAGLAGFDRDAAVHGVVQLQLDIMIA